MRRREIIALAGIAIAMPLTARGQQGSIPLIGYLHSESSEAYAPMIAAFWKGLGEMGYSEGRNISIQFAWAEGQDQNLPKLAAELVGRQVSVLVAGGGYLAARAAKAATNTVPIVFTVGADPVATHLVSGLARPDTNVTGVSFFTISLGSKRLELLHELAPNASTVAIIVHPDGAASDLADVRSSAQSIGQRLRIMKAANDQEIDEAFRTIGLEKPDALLILSHPFFTDRRAQIAALANHYRIPTAYPLREYVAAGGLLSYGASIGEAYRQAGVYVGRILRGAKPGDLPVLQPTRFALVINLRTAKEIGLKIPTTLLARADEVIE